MATNNRVDQAVMSQNPLMSLLLPYMTQAAGAVQQALPTAQGFTQWAGRNLPRDPVTGQPMAIGQQPVVAPAALAQAQARAAAPAAVAAAAPAAAVAGSVPALAAQQLLGGAAPTMSEALPVTSGNISNNIGSTSGNISNNLGVEPMPAAPAAAAGYTPAPQTIPQNASAAQSGIRPMACANGQCFPVVNSATMQGMPQVSILGATALANVANMANTAVNQATQSRTPITTQTIMNDPNLMPQAIEYARSAGVDLQTAVAAVASQQAASLGQHADANAMYMNKVVPGEQNADAIRLASAMQTGGEYNPYTGLFGDYAPNTINSATPNADGSYTIDSMAGTYSNVAPTLAQSMATYGRAPDALGAINSMQLQAMQNEQQALAKAPDGTAQVKNAALMAQAMQRLGLGDAGGDDQLAALKREYELARIANMNARTEGQLQRNQVPGVGAPTRTPMLGDY